MRRVDGCGWKLGRWGVEQLEIKVVCTVVGFVVISMFEITLLIDTKGCKDDGEDENEAALVSINTRERRLRDTHQDNSNSKV